MTMNVPSYDSDMREIVLRLVDEAFEEYLFEKETRGVEVIMNSATCTATMFFTVFEEFSEWEYHITLKNNLSSENEQKQFFDYGDDLEEISDGTFEKFFAACLKNHVLPNFERRIGE